MRSRLRWSIKLIWAQLLFVWFHPANCLQPFLTEEDYKRTIDEDVSFLTDKDFDNAIKYKSQLMDKHSDRGYLLSHQRFYHGDIRGKAQWLANLKAKGKRRNGVVSTIKKWPHGRIPYVLSTQYNERERAVLAKAFNEYHRQTCIKFTPKEPFDRDYLYIGKIDGCYSDVGKAGGRQELSLDDGCIQYDTIIHELMHSVGFYHEHERWDRDHFISILWQNIDKEAYDQFGRVDLTESSYYGQVYDYKSIMHYDSLAFSKNGKETLVAKKPGMTQIIGSALEFSPVDLIKIKKMYQCSSPSIITNPVVIPDNSYNVIQSPRSPWPSATGTISNAIDQPTILPAPSLISMPFSRSQLSNENSIQPCGDRSTLCYRWLDRCHSPFFEKIMKEFCAQSCGFCSPQPPRNTWRSYSDVEALQSSYHAGISHQKSLISYQRAPVQFQVPQYPSQDSLSFRYQQTSSSLPWYQVLG